MKVVILIVFLSVYGVHTLLLDDWLSFIVTNAKVYIDPVETALRKNIFAANQEIISKHNLNFKLGKVSFKLKMNRFGDLRQKEFISLLNGFNRNLTKLVKPTAFYLQSPTVKLPKFKDWRKSGTVTPVKNQGACKSCWAFSAVGALEGQHFRKTSKLVALSEQNLIDCSTTYGNNGCQGGIPNLAFQYIKKNHGINSETTYPYKAKDDVCRYTKNEVASSIKGYVEIPEGDENALQSAVATIGPIAAAIDASSKNFRLYSEGVYDEPNCSSKNLDHAVLVAGYGTTDSGLDYWLVKNSWGTDWGEEGYIKMRRNKNNQCGIATSASYPIV